MLCFYPQWGQKKLPVLSFISDTVLSRLSCVSQAFSWWPELMAEHAETFLSLYRADMDAALHVQPVDSWNSFPLFQLHNNFLCTDGEPHFHL